MYLQKQKNRQLNTSEEKPKVFSFTIVWTIYVPCL